MMSKVLYIDNRERSGLEDLVKKYCDKKGLSYTVNQNMITDYAFARIGIEAKSIHDYMSSLYSGHLERQLQNLDDNYDQTILVIWGKPEDYVTQSRKGGRRVTYQQVFGTFTGSIARFLNDYDITILNVNDRSTAARIICKRFEKHGTLGSSTTYRLLRKTASEDRRIDLLRAAGCSEAIAKRLLAKFGSISEITSCSPKELQTAEGVGKVRANRILLCLNSEEPVADEKVKMKRA
tara:strand:+ start:4460 stop:5167 length:708 start_codon:yes stop_codon:yes gene_type:complete